jgi:hypothetical protein
MRRHLNRRTKGEYKMRRVVSVLALVAIVCLSPHPAIAQASSAAPAPRYIPLVQGWERFFKLTWEPVQRKRQPYIGGYILNDWGFTATRVQLLVDALDSAGRVERQAISWLGHPVPPGSRVYFEVRAPQPAASYRVSVFAFDWLQTASIEAP